MMGQGAVGALVVMVGLVTFVASAGTAAAAGLASTEADEITLNVPIRLTSLPTEVKKGAITCDVRLNWNTGGAGATGLGMATGQISIVATGRTEFPVDPTTGNFSGNVAVKVKTGPPRQAVDFEEHLDFLGGDYFCWLSLASDSGDFYPGPPPRNTATGQATGRRGPAPPWAQAQGTPRMEVNGQIARPPR